SPSQPRAMLANVAGLFPVLLGTPPYTLLEGLILWPLEVYESIAIIPVSFLRRHMPVVGGALVILMTLHGILLRLFLEMMHGIFARITYSHDPVFNFRTFWLGMRNRYATMELRQIDWNFVHQLYGEALQSSTNEDDLWIALQESVAMCDDPSLVVTGGSANAVARGRKRPQEALRRFEAAALDIVESRHLTDCGRRVASNFVFGILNAETSPGWRIGYICLTSMEGFVEFPLPRVDSLATLWNQDTVLEGKSNLAVPEIYDLESMRWALDAILKTLGELDGLILDMRFNQGGGSLASSLAVASFFMGPKQSVAFLTDEKLTGTATQRFSRKKRHYVPSSGRSFRYGGPLVVLQSQYTRGTAEVLCMALMNRPSTCLIGNATAGSLAQTEKLRLPNYWTVDIPVRRCFSADGKQYEGIGVPPQKEVEQMEERILAAVAHCHEEEHEHDGEQSAERDESRLDDTFDPCIKKAIEHIMNV
ncbi:TPA: hypothetical protein N0F65_004222, partial [Lagenidium giganteum]